RKLQRLANPSRGPTSFLLPRTVTSRHALSLWHPSGRTATIVCVSRPDDTSGRSTVMRKSWGSVSAVALVALAAALAIGQAPKASAPDDKAIRQAATDYAAAMTKGDLDAVTGFWAADAEYVDDSGTVHRGRDAIIALFKKGLAELKGAKFASRVTS